MYVNVKGGTRAGWRMIKAAASDWRCPAAECGAKNKYYWLRCPVCKHPRPEKEGN